MTTKDMMTLQALLEKSSDADLLREMIAFTAEVLMGLAVGEAVKQSGKPESRRQPEGVARCEPHEFTKLVLSDALYYY